MKKRKISELWICLSLLGRLYVYNVTQSVSPKQDTETSRLGGTARSVLATAGSLRSVNGTCVMLGDTKRNIYCSCGQRENWVIAVRSLAVLRSVVGSWVPGVSGSVLRFVLRETLSLLFAKSYVIF